MVARTFPFLVDSSLATGGGQVADFKYHVIDTDKPFEIEGLEFMPLPGNLSKKENKMLWMLTL